MYFLNLGETIYEGLKLSPNTSDLMLEKLKRLSLKHTFNKDDMQRDRNFFEGKAVYQKKFSVAADKKDKRSFFVSSIVFALIK